MKVMKLSKMIEGKQILNDVHFELKANEIVGLIGRNGSGKTTLFRTLTGQYLPDKGEIELEGISLLTATQSKSELFYIDRLASASLACELSRLVKRYARFV